MPQLTIKTSTIFISKGSKTRIYHSLSEVPAPLREELERSTNGFESATILIADRKGREEITRALQGMPSSLRNTLTAKLDVRRTPVVRPIWHKPVSRFLRRNWAEILLPAAVGTVIWFVLNYN